MADISNIPIGDPTIMAIQLALQAAGQLGSGISNSIKTNYSQNISDPNVSNYMVNTDLFGDRGKSQAINSLQSNLKDFSDIQSKDVLLNTDVDMIHRVQDPSVGESLGMFVGDTLSNTAKDPISGAIGQWGNIRRAGKSLGARLGLWDSDADEMNKQIDYINSSNSDNWDNQFNNIEKRERRQAMLNYFAEGGYLDELNGVTKFNVGQSHSQNPNGGIQQGIASDGYPNLVEESEVKYKDYIYSARLKPSKSLLKEFNLPEKYTDKTFAELADILQQESKDRPNDPVSLQTLDDWMSRLADAQEEYKAKQAERKLAKALDSMPTEQKAAIMSSLGQPMDHEGIDLGQPMYADGGKIYIAKNKRGTFTAAAKKHGKSVQAFASQVLAHPENYSPAMRKKANFARNFGGHKHAEGGYPFGALGSGVEYIMGNYNPLTQTQINMLQDAANFANSNLPKNLNTLRFGVNQPKNNIELMAVTNPTEVSQGAAPITKSVTYTPDTDNNTKGSSNWLGNLFGNINGESLRYAPAFGAALGALEARLQPKDYALANELRNIASQYQPVSAPHIGGYRRYTPYDVNLGDAENIALTARALDANRGQNRATQSALNTAVLSTAQKTAAARNLAAQQANEANRLATDQYNLGIDQFNAQRDTQYDQLNQQILNNRLRTLMSAAEAEDASRTAWAQNISSTTENMYNQLGNVGRDNWTRNQRDIYLRDLGYDPIALLSLFNLNRG